MNRTSTINRETTETKIDLTLNLDGNGKNNINTNIGFFDHMLTQISRHGFLDLDLTCVGDLHVDSHHSVEDVGIVLGKAINKALGDKKNIKRYGNSIIPMEEALILCALDISGRPYLNFEVEFSCEKLGELQTEMIEEFFRALCIHAGLNLHIKMLNGKNNHHICEGIFKAFAKSFDEAKMVDPRITGVLSSKGMLE